MCTRRKTNGARPPTKEEIRMTQEERRCNRLFKIAMRGIASFYGNTDAALHLLKEFIAMSPSKYAARDAIIMRSRLELVTFRIRKSKGLPLREQRVEMLERALFPRSGNVKGKTPGTYKMDKMYHGSGQKH